MKKGLIEKKSFSKLIGLTQKEINDLIKKGMPNENNKFDLYKALPWLISFLKNQSSNSNFISRKEVASLLNYNERYINHLESAANLPKEAHNQYDLMKLFKWTLSYLNNLHNNEIEKLKGSTSKAAEATIRLKTAQAEKVELENKIETEQLIFKETFFVIINEVFSNIRSKMLGFPNRIAYQIFGSKDIVEAKIKAKQITIEILNELANPELLFKKRNKRGRKNSSSSS